MRSPISPKSNTCTESVDVNVTDISAKVTAQYPGRSVVWLELSSSKDEEIGQQKSADGIVGQATMTEGQNIMMRVGASTFDDEGDADSMTEMSETDQGRIRRKRREHDAGASSVTARRTNSNPEGVSAPGVVVARESNFRLCSRSSNANRNHHYEPPYTEPYVRWCGRTADVNPPPTRSRHPPMSPVCPPCPPSFWRTRPPCSTFWRIRPILQGPQITHPGSTLSFAQ